MKTTPTTTPIKATEPTTIPTIRLIDDDDDDSSQCVVPADDKAQFVPSKAVVSIDVADLSSIRFRAGRFEKVRALMVVTSLAIMVSRNRQLANADSPIVISPLMVTETSLVFSNAEVPISIILSKSMVPNKESLNAKGRICVSLAMTTVSIRDPSNALFGIMG